MTFDLDFILETELNTPAWSFSKNVRAKHNQFQSIFICNQNFRWNSNGAFLFLCPNHKRHQTKTKNKNRIKQIVMVSVATIEEWVKLPHLLRKYKIYLNCIFKGFHIFCDNCFLMLHSMLWSMQRDSKWLIFSFVVLGWLYRKKLCQNFTTQLQKYVI